MLKNRLVSENHSYSMLGLYFFMVLAGNSLSRKKKRCRSLTWIRIFCNFLCRYMLECPKYFLPCWLSKTDVSFKDQKLNYHAPLLIRFSVKNFLFYSLLESKGHLYFWMSLIKCSIFKSYIRQTKFGAWGLSSQLLTFSCIVQNLGRLEWREKRMISKAQSFSSSFSWCVPCVKSPFLLLGYLQMDN